MDYKEEQSNEIEALDSIYCGEFEIIQSEPLHIFTIPIKSNTEDNVNQMSCVLKFHYTPKYPEEIPLIEIENCDNIDDDIERELSQYLSEQATENLGMVMIFTLVSAAQEWLSTKSEQIESEKILAEEKRIKAEEEAERKRFEGTLVTLETFLIWKSQFDKEMAHIIFEEKNKAKEKIAGKLTGRELFMQDNSMNVSDLKFIEDNGPTDDADSVEVNETLFQDMHDLDLSSDEDDEDYVPGDESDD